MARFALSCLRLKQSKTTLLIPVTPSTTLANLRSEALAALQATAAHNADDVVLAVLPDKPEDIALWRKDPVVTPEGAEDNWVRLTDEKSGADKWGVGESEEIGFSFRAEDGSFPEPSVDRPIDDYKEQS
ncbi:hypothetical protein JCM8547_003304 [Rhodosporidiobolus lusitaniae]